MGIRPLKIKLTCALLIAVGAIFLLIAISDLTRGVFFALLGGITFLALGALHIVSSIAILKDLKYSFQLALVPVLISIVVILISKAALEVKLTLQGALLVALAFLAYAWIRR